MTQAKSICSFCDKGELTDTTYSSTLNPRGWDGGEFTVHNMEGSICDHCEIISVSMSQSHRNLEKINAEKRRLTGLPTGAEIKNIQRKAVATEAMLSK